MGILRRDGKEVAVRLFLGLDQEGSGTAADVRAQAERCRVAARKASEAVAEQLAHHRKPTRQAFDAKLHGVLLRPYTAGQGCDACRGPV